MISMTGYARAAGRGAGVDVDLELRTVNHRYLMTRLTVPEELGRFEPQIEKLIRQHVRRGTVSMRVTWRRASPAPDARRLRARVKQFDRALRDMKRAMRDTTPVTTVELLAIPNFWSGVEDPGPDPDGLWKIVEPLLKKALDALSKVRAREGRQTGGAVRRHLDRIDGLAREIEKRAPGVTAAYEARLRARIDGVVKASGLNVASVELAKEIGIFADRADVSEEIARLRFHLDQMRKALSSSDAVGRRIEFIAQEMTRESNTTAAKANDAPISAMAVEIKGEIEKIKEQAENLE